eukprot:4893398-Amphidinium_carterae.1
MLDHVAMWLLQKAHGKAQPKAKAIPKRQGKAAPNGLACKSVYHRVMWYIAVSNGGHNPRILDPEDTSPFFYQWARRWRLSESGTCFLAEHHRHSQASKTPQLVSRRGAKITSFSL